MLPEIERFHKWLRRKSPGASTHVHYTSDVALFFAWLGKAPAQVKVRDVDAYIEQAQQCGHAMATVNRRLAALRSFYAFLALESDDAPANPVVPRRHFVRQGERLPRDLEDATVDRLLAVVTHPRDRAMFLLMLRYGLRTGEVRRLRLGHLDLGARRVRIEQSKGLKDRLVCLSEATVEALNAYLAVRGPADEHVFVFRHAPLSGSYCSERLHTYGRRCGVHVTPHQLRHTCATLLLNAGAPILTVQTILGHRHVDTTLGYARLYDGTVAADYYRAMAQVEARLDGSEGRTPLPPGQLLALVDALQAGTLNEAQREAVQALRTGISALVEGTG